jgi:hypothetical protein
MLPAVGATLQSTVEIKAQLKPVAPPWRRRQCNPAAQLAGRGDQSALSSASVDRLVSRFERRNKSSRAVAGIHSSAGAPRRAPSRRWPGRGRDHASLHGQRREPKPRARGAVQPIHLARLPCMRRCACLPGQSSYLACRETGRLSAMAIKSAGVLTSSQNSRSPHLGGLPRHRSEPTLGWAQVKAERPCVGFSHEQVGWL